MYALLPATGKSVITPKTKALVYTKDFILINYIPNHRITESFPFLLAHGKMQKQYKGRLRKVTVLRPENH